MRATLLFLLLGCSTANAKSKPVKAPKPTISSFTPTEVGAKFTVLNPLDKAIWVRFECENAFSEYWSGLEGHNKRTFIITAGEPIDQPCTLVWKVQKP